MFTLANYNKRFELNVTYFMFYAFLGWLIETIYVSIQNQRFTMRGVLFGPFCPVYGFGAILILASTCVFLQINNPILKILSIFVVGSITTTIIEYTTSLLMETVTGKMLWDYSLEMFNFYGRICLKITLSWGVLSILVALVIHPLLIKIFRSFSSRALHILVNLFLIYVIYDTTASFSGQTNINIMQSFLSIF